MTFIFQCFDEIVKTSLIKIRFKTLTINVSVTYIEYIQYPVNNTYNNFIFRLDILAEIFNLPFFFHNFLEGGFLLKELFVAASTPPNGSKNRIYFSVDQLNVC